MQEFEIIINKYLNILLKEFKCCKSKKKYFELIRSFYILFDTINKLKLNINISDELKYELNKINVDKYFKKYDNDNIDYVEKYYYYNLEFSKLFISLNKLTSDSYEDFKQYISIKETIKLVKSFFEYYDINMYNYFIDTMLGKNGLWISNGINNPCTSASNYLLPPYSFIKQTNTFMDFISIVHESSHNYIKNILRYMNTEERNRFLINNFEEVFPSFVELVSIKYLRDNNISFDDIDTYEKLVNKSIINFLIDYFNSLVTKDFDNCRESEAYSYGRVLSYHFYDNYLNDNNKNNVVLFTLDSKLYDKKYLLNNYGLNKIELLSPYKLIKYLK